MGERFMQFQQTVASRRTFRFRCPTRWVQRSGRRWRHCCGRMLMVGLPPLGERSDGRAPLVRRPVPHRHPPLTAR